MNMYIHLLSVCLSASCLCLSLYPLSLYTICLCVSVTCLPLALLSLLRISLSRSLTCLSFHASIASAPLCLASPLCLSMCLCQSLAQMFLMALSLMCPSMASVSHSQCVPISHSLASVW